jgi:hypothetical protein
MLEELLKITKKISDELQKRTLEEREWYLYCEKIANEDIAYNQKIAHNEKQPNIARALASHIIATESQKMLMLAEQNLLLDYMARFSLTFEIAITTIEKELSELKNTATSTSRNDYDEKIRHVETKLTQLQQESDSMRPYYDAIRASIEKMKKWRNNNK